MSGQPTVTGPRHPTALYRLSLIEFFERLAFAAVMPLFVLYLHEQRGYPEDLAMALSSGFLGASYLASLPGGYMADRVLGPIWAARLGLVLLAIGSLGMAVDKPAMLWPALTALLGGQGLFKPGITTLLSNLYPSGDRRREAGFAIFYVAVNLGALAGPLMAEWMRVRWGWGMIFVSAGVALLPALILTATSHTDQRPAIACNPSTVDPASQQQEQGRSHAVYLLCGVSLAFWIAFQQTATTLMFFAERHTVESFTILRWSFPTRPGHFAAFHAALVIGLTPLLIALLGHLRVRRLEPSTPLKLILGFLFTATAFGLIAGAGLSGGDEDRVSPLWLGGCYLLLALGELLLSPIGLSLVTELAPRRLLGRFTGIWFASVALGHGVAGPLGFLWGRWPHHRYFALMALLVLSAAGVLIGRRRSLERVLSRKNAAVEPLQPSPL